MHLQLQSFKGILSAHASTKSFLAYDNTFIEYKKLQRKQIQVCMCACAHFHLAFALNVASLICITYMQICMHMYMCAYASAPVINMRLNTFDLLLLIFVCTQ